MVLIPRTQDGNDVFARPRTLITAFALGGWILVQGPAASASLVPHEEGRFELEPGLVVERWSAPPTSTAKAAPLVTLVRVDPSRFSFHLLTARDHGGARSAPQWQREFDLVGVINAGMYMPNQRSAGLMIDGDRINNGYDNPAYGGFLCFDPRQPGLEPVILAGRTCEGFDLRALRQEYQVVVQGYRLLDCARQPMAWADPKLYSSAAIGLDEDGWVVLIHTGTSYRMSDLTRWLARPTLRITAAIFVEGGSHASLLVEQGERQVREAGTRSTHATAAVDFRAVPNVIGFRRAAASR
jgi:hypothetical protein